MTFPIWSHDNFAVHLWSWLTELFLTGINLTLRWSMTDGNSWEKEALQIWPGPSGYSCITSLDGDSVDDRKHIYVIYEKGQKDYDETVSFAKIHLYGGR